MSRPIPFLLKIQVLFGGWANGFGWLFFGFGLVFFWTFALNADVSFLTMRGKLQSAQGVVIGSEKTRATEGGSKRSKGTPIYANHFSFAHDGKKFEGVSYATGRQLGTGTSVTVEFVEGNPSISRIRGMRRALFGFWAVFIAIFPAVGLCFIIVGMKKGIKAAGLLSDGVLASGTLKSKIETNTRYNKKPVYELIFEFRAEDGQIYHATTRTHEPESLEDNELEPLLYRRWKPSEAVTLDDLPGAPRFDELGRLQGGTIPGFLGAVIFPTLTVVGHGSYLLASFLK